MLRESPGRGTVESMSVVTFEALCAKPAVFQSMTGVSVEGFRSLLTQVSPRYEAADRNRAERADRHRAPGGGEKSRHDVSERLLMTLVWLRLYLTCEAIGFLISVDKGTVSRFTRPVLLILGDLGVETLGWPEESVALAAPADEGPDPPDPPVGTPSDRAEPAEGPRETAGTPVVTPDESG